LLTQIDYFTKVLEDNLKAVVKPQYVDQIPRAVKGPIQQVQQLIEARAAMDNEDEIMEVLGAFLNFNILTLIY
jgi:ATP-binding cassette subfamily E protein 1